MINFRPQDWQAVGSYYVGTVEDIQDAMCEDTGECEDLLRAGKRHPESHTLRKFPDDVELSGICDHCAAIHAWGVLLADHEGHLMALGHTCAEKVGHLPASIREERSKAERDARAAAHRRGEVRKGLRAIVDAEREATGVIAFLRGEGKFPRAMRRAVFDRWGWSAKQRAAVIKCATATPADGYAWPLINPAEAAPVGRISGSFRVLSAKEVTGDYGTTIKGLCIEIDRGFTVWCTLPDLKRGAVYLGKVTLAASDRPTHAWGSRPAFVEAGFLTPAGAVAS